MVELIKRENTIFEVLRKFSEEKLDFVIVRGYAVSAYKHRFSVDVDIVIKNEDKSKFENILKKNKFEKTIIKILDHVYAKEFVRYETKDKFPVSIDILIEGIGSRTTNALFSINELKDNSEERLIKGIEKEVYALIPDKEFRWFPNKPACALF